MAVSNANVECLNADAIELQSTYPNSHDSERNDRSTSRAQNSPTDVNTAVSIPLKGVAILKLASASLCFLNAGINDGSLGALIPYMLKHYAISSSLIALTYSCAFTGWLIAAAFGGYVRIRLGSGGSIVLGAGLQVLAQALRFWAPPFGMLAITFFITALGQGTQEPQVNTFVSNLDSAHRWLGLIHGCYAIGGTIGPFVATAMASRNPARWAHFYYIPCGVGMLNLLLCCYAFRGDLAVWPQQRSDAAQAPPQQQHGRVALFELRATVKQKTVWLISIFFFLHLGAGITAGGWVVDYLHVARKGQLSRVGYISGAFYGGVAAGRIILAEPTYRFGEKRMLILYGTLCLILEIVFWRVPDLIVDAIVVCLMGVLLGPMFVTGISVGSKLIPIELQPSGLGLIFVLAQAGGAMFPAVTGIISAHAGVATLQPMLVGLIAAMTLSWCFVPDPRKTRK